MDKVQLFQTALAIKAAMDGNTPLELTVESVGRIKSLAGELFSPLFVGRLFDQLDVKMAILQ
jgi:hypothetical protein